MNNVTYCLIRKNSQGEDMLTFMRQFQQEISEMTISELVAAYPLDGRGKRHLRRCSRATRPIISAEDMTKCERYAKHVYSNGYVRHGSTLHDGGGALPLSIQSSFNIATSLHKSYLKKKEPIRLFQVSILAF